MRGHIDSKRIIVQWGYIALVCVGALLTSVSAATARLRTPEESTVKRYLTLNGVHQRMSADLREGEPIHFGQLWKRLIPAVYLEGMIQIPNRLKIPAGLSETR